MKRMDMGLSRRAFLQIMGVTATVGAAAAFRSVGAEQLSQLAGRALEAAPMRAMPHRSAVVTGTLWPDSMVSIVGERGGWYQTEQGWTPREMLQPMLPYAPAADSRLLKIGEWVEVAAPAASIRVMCAADAPLVGRIGYGGVLRIVDALPGEPYGWIAVADAAGELLGWSQAAFWRGVEEPVRGTGERSLVIDSRQFEAMAIEAGREVMVVRCTVGDEVRLGRTAPTAWQISSTVDSDEHRLGVPWQVAFEGGKLFGAYWHNAFGRVVPGSSVEVPVLAARWLYGWLNPESVIEVI
ncbi:MAG: L,D-transpeptidase [Anaerolineae bacterium]|nr:L,D-transpeptidase [Anaerolineae bacterium]